MKKKELKARITELEAELAIVTRERDILIRDEDGDQVEIASMRAQRLLLSSLQDIALTGICEWKTEFGIPCRGERTRVKVNGRFIP